MSRIGRAPIAVPAGVEIKVEDNNVVTVKGPKGTLTQQFHPNITITVEGAGEYTLSWDLPEETTVSDALVFVVDVVGGGKDGFVLADLAITADDVDVPVDLAKVVTGDVE